MNKKKLQQIICMGALTTMSVSLTPAYAYQYENNSKIEQSSNQFSLDMRDVGDTDDDEVFEEEPTGKIIVKHIDIDTGAELNPGEVYDDVPYGESKVVSTLNISGYTLQDSKEKIVYVNESNPVVTVIFKYKSNKPATTPPTTPPTTTPPSNNNGGNNNSGGSNNNGNTSSGGNTNNTQKPSTGNNTTTQKPATPTNTLNEVVDKVDDAVTVGTVIINYVEANTGQIFKTTKEEGLSLTESYTYSATEEEGYTLCDDNSKTITLSKDNPEATLTFKYIKNGSVSTFGRARLLEAYENDKGLTVYSASGTISVGEDLLKYLLDNENEYLVLELKEELSNMTIVEELTSLHDLNVLSTFAISSNIDCEDTDGVINVTKKLDTKYNDNIVYVYSISSDNSIDLVEEKEVKEGNVSFSTSLASMEYFISDVKIQADVESNVDNVAPVEEEMVVIEEKSSVGAAWVMAAVVAVAGIIVGGVKIFKNKNKDENVEEENESVNINEEDN